MLHASKCVAAKQATAGRARVVVCRAEKAGKDVGRR